MDAVCPVTVAGQPLLASGGGDGTVRIWDPATGQQRAMLEGHQGGVNAVCPVTVAGEALLASGGDDRTVRIWDPATGTCTLAVPIHHAGLAIVSIDGLLAIGLDAGILTISLNHISLTQADQGPALHSIARHDPSSSLAIGCGTAPSPLLPSSPTGAAGKERGGARPRPAGCVCSSVPAFASRYARSCSAALTLRSQLGGPLNDQSASRPGWAVIVRHPYSADDAPG